MREMLLLGAGASVEAEVPAANKMTECIAEIFRNSPLLQIHSKVVAFVIGGLLFKRGIEGTNALTAGVNVEELFNAVQLLAERGTIEASPFVGSWHAMVEELDKLEPPSPSIDRITRAIQRGVAEQIKSAIPSYVSSHFSGDIDRNLQTTIQKTVEAMVKCRSVSVSSGSSLSRAVSSYVEEFIKKWTDGLRNSSPSNYALQHELGKLADQQPRSARGSVYEDVCEEMIQTLVNIVWLEECQRVQYLRPVLSLLRRQEALTVATLNYDNSIELMARTGAAQCTTGIAEWSQTGDFPSPEKGMLLLKLHGSIDWALDQQRNSAKPMSHSVVSPVDAATMKRPGFRPAVIFGNRNKLTAEGPFLDLLRAFRRELEKADLLTVVGYSFGDTHVNVFIANWLNANPDRKVRIVNRGFSKCESEFAKELRSLVPTRVEVMPQTAGMGLREIYGDLPVSSSAPTAPN